ncbi:MAG TPA: Gx transporter family protein [Fibrobacteria bacterium]|nr:Gx transporter family protein [Fibrobacteria bacterium]
MPSPIEGSGRKSSGRKSSGRGNLKVTAGTFALALLAASGLQIMENLLPRFPLFPWMRIGFSYVIILPFLMQYGPRAAFALFLARNGITVLYGGQPLTTFLIGSGAGVLALLGLGRPVAWAYRRGSLGILGAGILLATAFNLAQLALVNLTLIRHAGFYFQTGPILAWSLVSGACVALLIRFSEKELLDLFAPEPEPSSAAAFEAAALPPPARPAPFLAGMLLMLSLFALPDLRVQVPVLAVLLVAVRDRGRMLLHSWPFFFYLAWLHLFHTSGAYLWGEWITREGARDFALYAARLANLILLGRWLSSRFPWQWAGRPRSPYLRGFLLALPLMADLLKPSLQAGRDMLRNVRAGRRTGVLAPAFASWRGRMREAARAAVRDPGNPDRTAKGGPAP